MKRNLRKQYFTRYLGDAVALLLAYGGTIQLHYNSWAALSYVVFPGLSLGFWFLLSPVSRLYAERRSNKFSEEIVFIAYNVLLLAILLSSSFYFFKPAAAYTPGFLRDYLCWVFVLVTLEKYLLRKSIHAALHQGKLYDKILLVGNTPAAQNYYETINKFYYYGYTCVGVLDQQPTQLNGCPYFGGIDRLSEVLEREHIDEVVIALPNSEYRDIQRCIDVCESRRTKVRILPDLQQYQSSAMAVDNIGLVPTLSLIELPLDKWQNKMLKRAFDVAFSLVIFATVGLVLFPLIALIIKITSRGTVFFKQERWGLNNAKITCYKFRTMVMESRDVDAQGQYQQAQRNDPRVTWIGRILRKTNLDELPQFLNVLLGNMSVVGPRPHPTPLNVASMHTVDNYMLRHMVLPGISGWAQVNGCRGETKHASDMQKRVNLDLYYIHRWTFWLDCQIILQTVINILRGDQNAY